MLRIFFYLLTWNVYAYRKQYYNVYGVIKKKKKNKVEQQRKFPPTILLF